MFSVTKKKKKLTFIGQTMIYVDELIIALEFNHNTHQGLNSTALEGQKMFFEAFLWFQTNNKK
jgi:hypothetical protein